MNWVTVIWSMAASACLTLALIHFVIWIKDRASPVHLLFALSALSVAGVAAGELRMMLSSSPEVFGSALRWTHVPLFVAVVSIVWFVRLYFRAGRLWLAWLICAVRALTLILNFTFAPNLNYNQITAVRGVPFIGDATVTVAEGQVSSRTRLGELVPLLLFVFVVDASVTVWRRGNPHQRRRALIVGGSIVFFIVAGAGHAALIHAHLLHTPYMVSIAFLVPIVAMAFQLGSDVVESSRAETREAELTHLARVALLGELSASLAHELNQPLTAILSNAQAAQEFLANGAPDLDEVRGILKDIVDEDRRAGEIIRRLRLLFRKGQVQFEAIDLNELVLEVLKLMNSNLVNHGVAVHTELKSSLPRVSGDRVQLQQVLINLIVNASDAMAGEEIPDRQLSVSTRYDGTNGVDLCVADTGCGIRTDPLDQIFEPFHTTKPNGMGLGLAVCRTIISAHAGKLWATNNPDRGACLHVAIPAIPVEAVT
ncbi:MAG TPA: ATP-binding protein [Tepidisphaeraceae bacterium]|jgi:signal transduction histidine kinase